MTMLFEPNSRIEETDYGIRFYEQDIVFSSYLFEEDLIADIHIDYLHPGFGFVIAEKYKDGPRNSEKVHLFYFDNNVCKVIERNVLINATRKVNTCIFSPGIYNTNAHLIFEKKNKSIKIYHTEIDNKGKESKRELCAYKLSRKLGPFYIGYFSSANNIIRDITYLSGAPKKWNVNIANTEGGRIAFYDDGFLFENCINDAEIEQDKIYLNAGKYYVGYEKEEVNNTINDINCFIFPSYCNKPFSEYVYLPHKLDVVDNKVEFILKHTPIKNLRVIIDKLETNSSNYSYDGNTNTLTWLFDSPEKELYGRRIQIAYDYQIDNDFEDDKKNILNYEDNSFTIKEDMYISIKFKGINGKIKNICIKETAKQSFVETFDEAVEIDGSWIKIFLNNVSKIKWKGVIYDTPDYLDMTKPCPYAVVETLNSRLRLADLNIKKKEYYSYIYDNETKKVTTYLKDTTSGYNTLIFESEENELKIFDNLNGYIDELIIVDLKGNERNVLTQKTFKKYISSEILGPILICDLDNEPLDLSASYREIYDNKNKVYNYIFTNYEREIFTDLDSRIFTEKQIADTNGNIILYGIKNRNNIERNRLLNDIEKNLYKVCSEAMINSIDLCANEYDLISDEKFEVDYDNNEIKINPIIKDNYEIFIVDYLKANSYAINYKDTLGEYEVDICMEEEKAILSYDMAEDGSINTHKITLIKPDRSKYILLRRKPGAFD
jgi:hypothetical protein